MTRREQPQTAKLVSYRQRACILARAPRQALRIFDYGAGLRLAL
jgi:hypothetical protein